MPAFVMDMATSVREVEKLLEYDFENKKLLEEALTHPSYSESTSYQRLEFFGDAALGLAISKHLYFAYPDLNPGFLSLLRDTNVSNEKLARVAVKHGLFKYVRHNASSLDEIVSDFIAAVEREDQMEIYGGDVKAPKILADIVESIAAAVYLDCEFDLGLLWMTIRRLLEPIVTPDVLQQHPVTLLNDLCQKDGRKVKTKVQRIGGKTRASVFVDGVFVAANSSYQKKKAKVHAAKAALQKLYFSAADKLHVEIHGELIGIESAKQKLHNLCAKKKWAKPYYRIEEEIGPAHERRFVYSVNIELPEGVLFATGDEKSRVRDAKKSAALFMLQYLLEAKYI